MRFVSVILFIVFLYLQASLWGNHGLLEYWTLSRSNQQEKINNEELKERNQILKNELADLKRNGGLLEELARENLGMVKPGETFFKVIQNHTDQDASQ
ncbi:MAG: septum formation initiator family protein [Chromatiales bacterium]|nr:septum formation initiator family protein [Chromatiales bacterium]